VRATTVLGVRLSETEKLEPPRPKPRIEGLSDLIFGLALSIGAITLVENPPKTSLAIYQDVATFAFSFYILISTWLRYTRIMSVLPLERRRTVLANVVLLFCVAIEPFLYNLLQSSVTGVETSSFLATASTLFAFDIGGMTLMLGLFCNEIATKDRKLVPTDLIGSFRTERNRWLLSAALFSVSAIPIFWSIQIYGTQIRFWIWIAALILALAERRYSAIQTKRDQPKANSTTAVP
jgi:uncharacterized membrane protein